MARDKFLSGLQRAAQSLTDRGVADTEADDTDVVDSDDEAEELDENDEELLEENGQELPQASKLTGRVFLVSKVPTYATALFSGTASILLTGIAQAATAILKANKFDSIQCIATTLESVGNQLANPLTDVVILLDDQEQGALAITYPPTAGNEENGSFAAKGKMYIRIICPLRTFDRYVSPKVLQASTLFMNAGRALVHEVVTHAYGFILDTLSGTQIDLNSYYQFGSHSIPNDKYITCEGVARENMIGKTSRTYKIRKEEIILPQTKLNINSLFAFAYEVKRLGLRNDFYFTDARGTRTDPSFGQGSVFKNMQYQVLFNTRIVKAGSKPINKSIN